MNRRLSEDSRLHGFQTRVTHPVLPLERTFCTNCGQPSGWVATDSNNNILTETGESVSPSEVIVLCQKCDDHFNKLGGALLQRAPIKEY